MFCEKCGRKLEEGEECNCQAKKEKSKMKFNLSDVINSQDILQSDNKVAYIAKCWALKVLNRGKNVSALALIICFIYGVILQSNASSLVNGTPYWLLYTIYGVILAFIILAIFNTIAFIVRMGAEVIELLDNIKSKK